MPKLKRYLNDTVFKISAGLQTLTGKTWVGPASFPSLPYILGKIVLWSGKFQILFWGLMTFTDDSYFWVYLLSHACSWMLTEMAEVSNWVSFGSKSGHLTYPEKSRQRADPMISRLVRKKRYGIQLSGKYGTGLHLFNSPTLVFLIVKIVKRIWLNAVEKISGVLLFGATNPIGWDTDSALI